MSVPRGITVKTTERLFCLLCLFVLSGCGQVPASAVPGVTDLRWATDSNPENDLLATVAADAITQLRASRAGVRYYEKRDNGKRFTHYFRSILPLEQAGTGVYEVRARKDPVDLQLFFVRGEKAILVSYDGIGPLTPASKAGLAKRLLPLIHATVDEETWLSSKGKGDDR